MDLGEILSVVRARWYILVPMMVLAAVLGLGVYGLVPTSFESTTTVSLLSSPSATAAATAGEDNENPFLNFNGSLVATADFLGRSLQSNDAQAELLNMGVTEDYEVALAEGAQGPFLTIKVTGTDKAHVLTSTGTIARYADARLKRIQEDNGVKAQDMVRLTEIIPPQKPEPQLKKKLQLVIMAGGGTAALGLLLTFVVESRRRRKELAASPSGAAEGSARVPGGPSPGRAPQPPDVGRNERAAANEPGKVANGAEHRSSPVGSEQTVVIRRPPPSPAPGAERRPSIDEDTVVTHIPRSIERIGRNGEPPHAPRTTDSPPRVRSSTYLSADRSRARGQDVDRRNGG